MVKKEDSEGENNAEQTALHLVYISAYLSSH